MVFFHPAPTAAEIAASPNPTAVIVWVVVDAILEVFFLCAVGWIMAYKGIIDEKVKKVLNRVNVSLFTPALLFGKVAFSLTPEKLLDLYLIPIGFVLITAFSAGVAFALGTLFRLKKGQRNFAIACAMFQNSNSLPIALMQSLIGEAMPLQWGEDDTPDQMLGRALSYLVLFSTLGIVVRWSFGVRLLASAESDDSYFDEHDAEAVAGAAATPAAGALTGRAIRAEPVRRESIGPTTLGNGAGEGISGRMGSGAKRKSGSGIVPASFPNTPARSRTATEETDLAEEEDELDGHGGWGAPRGVGRAGLDENETWAKVKRVAWKVWRPVYGVLLSINDFMTVPLWAALMSLFVACVPPLQRTLHDIEPLKSAIASAGSCSVPITLVTLGAYFYRPADPSRRGKPSLLQKLNPVYWIKGRKAEAEGEGEEHEALLAEETGRRRSVAGEGRTVWVAVLSRMVVVPLCLIPLFHYYAKATTNVADDPVFIVVACLLIGSPAAITLAQLTSSSGSDVFEKLISKTLFISYAIMTAPSTILLALAALWISRNQ